MPDAILAAAKKTRADVLRRVREWVLSITDNVKKMGVLDVSRDELGWLREHDVVTRARTTRVTLIVEREQGGQAITDTLIFDQPTCFDMTGAFDDAQLGDEARITGTVITILKVRS